MAKIGRPKSESPKSNFVGIRLSDEDYEKLIKYASEHHLTITQTILEGVMLLLNKPKQ